jgi:hypothetical protein
MQQLWRVLCDHRSCCRLLCFQQIMAPFKQSRVAAHVVQAVDTVVGHLVLLCWPHSIIDCDNSSHTWIAFVCVQVRVKLAEFEASITRPPSPDGADPMPPLIPIMCGAKITFSMCNTANSQVGDKVDVLLRHQQSSQDIIQTMSDAMQLSTTSRFVALDIYFATTHICGPAQ